MNVFGPPPDALVPFLVFLVGGCQIGYWTGSLIAWAYRRGWRER